MNGRLKRPKGWGQQYILDRLEEGETLKQICARGADRCGCAAETLADDIKKWRDRDQAFHDHIEDLLERLHGTVAGRGSRVKLTEEKQEEFFAAMHANGGKLRDAAEAVGLHPSTIYARLSPSAPTYDEAFANRFHVLEAVRLGEHREKMMELPDRAEALGDIRTEFNARAFLLKTGMPHLHSEKSELRISGTVDHRHRLAGLQELKLIADHARAAPERLLPSGDVVEGEVVE